MSNGNIVRIHKNKNYTTIDNGFLKNKEMSLKAKGLLTLLLSLSSGWSFSESGLASLSSDGRASIRTALEELEKHGYLFREQNRDKGKFANVIYHIYEIPRFELPMSEKPLSDNPTSVNQHNKVLINKVPIDKALNNKDIVGQSPTTYPFSEIIDYLNLKAETQYRVSSAKTQSLVKARFNEGFELEDFKTVIDKKTNEWKSDNKMSVFLRPETLFGTKFESYLNQKGTKIEKDIGNDGSEFGLIL